MIRKIKLGDKLTGKFLCVRKSELGVDLIEPKTEIDYLSIQLNVGN